MKKKKTFVIAEIGINHNGKLSNAFKLIDSAIRAKVNAVKFQTYKTEKRVKKNSPIFHILKRNELSFSDFVKIKHYCDKKKIEFFSTPFDIESFDFLRSINVKKVKIASFDTVNKKFLKYMSKFKMEFILSVGMSNLKEIKKAYKLLYKEKKNKVTILHCISSYPNLESNSNLACIDKIRKEIGCGVGLSDHTNDIFVPLCAVARGASIIEKHFTINSRYQCVDKSVSITEAQMSKMVSEIRRIEKIIGNDYLGLREQEKNTKIFRRYS